MRRIRVALVLAGTLLLGYGSWSLTGATRRPAEFVALGAWLLAGLLAPLLVVRLAGAVGGLLARVLPRPWRTTVAVAAGISGTLLLVALATLTDPAVGDGGGQPAGLLAFLGVLWGLLLGATLSRIARDQRRGRW